MLRATLSGSPSLLIQFKLAASAPYSESVFIAHAPILNMIFLQFCLLKSRQAGVVSYHEKQIVEFTLKGGEFFLGHQITLQRPL